MAWHTEDEDGEPMNALANDRPEQNPVDEHGEMLSGRLANAEKRIAQAQMHMEEARLQLAQWKPVAESCRAGLETLKSNQLKAVAT
jgi:hypothetical protein